MSKTKSIVSPETLDGIQAFYLSQTEASKIYSLVQKYGKLF